MCVHVKLFICIIVLERWEFFNATVVKYYDFREFFAPSSAFSPPSVECWALWETRMQYEYNSRNNQDKCHIRTRKYERARYLWMEWREKRIQLALHSCNHHVPLFASKTWWYDFINELFPFPYCLETNCVTLTLLLTAKELRFRVVSLRKMEFHMRKIPNLIQNDLSFHSSKPGTGTRSLKIAWKKIWILKT